MVQSGIHDAFVAALAKRVDALRVGAGTEAGVDIGPMINTAAIDKINAHVADALDKGAIRVTQARNLPGHYADPVVLSGASTAMRLASEETFGPVAPIFRFDTEEEALALANGTPFGLAAYFYTRDMARAFRFGEALEFGMVGLNTGLISNEVSPCPGRDRGIPRDQGLPLRRAVGQAETIPRRSAHNAPADPSRRIVIGSFGKMTDVASICVAAG
jgi:succinate-semialdehyde dehydrogenase/glutarate-semialdehyde dehydrogenase